MGGGVSVRAAIFVSSANDHVLKVIPNEWEFGYSLQFF